MNKLLTNCVHLPGLFALLLSLCISNEAAAAVSDHMETRGANYAKDLFIVQLKNREKPINNGFVYSIELHRSRQVPVLCAVNSEFHSGDGIKIRVRSNFKAYAYVLLAQGSTGRRTVLYPPVSGTQSKLLEADREYILPEKGVIRFDQNPGTEKLLFILSRKAIDLQQVLASQAVSINSSLSSGLPIDSDVSVSSESVEGVPSANTYVVKDDPLQVVYAELSLKHLPATSHTAIVAGSSSTAIVADRKATVPGGGAAAPIQLPDGSPTTTTVATTSTAATTTTATTASTSSESLLPPSTPSTAPALATATGPASTGTQINRPITDKWAVIVGLSKYKDSSMNLKAPRKDSEAFAEFLINDAGFAQSHVIKIYDKDASREKIMSTLEELGRRMRPDDLFVFYANCHGSSTQKDGGNYLLLWDYGGSMKKQLLMQELSQTLKTKVPSERIVVIVQACHSGFVKDANFPSPEAVSKDLMGVGRIVATACLGSESSWVYPRGGVFTRALIPNLRKYPKLKEALTHTRDAVIAATEDDKLSQQMHPIIKYDLWTGDDAVLMAVPTAPQP